MTTRLLRALYCACMLLAISLPATAQERRLHTLQPRNALPEQLAPVLAAQVGPGSSVTAYGNQLVLNVTDSELQQLQQLLQQLDTAPRSLLISVRRAGQDQYSAQRIEGSGRLIGGGDADVYGGGQRRPQDGARVTIEQRSASASRDGNQQVRAVEGTAAYIGEGLLQPVPTGYGGQALLAVESGFYATARVMGSEVIVDIEKRDDRAGDRTIRSSGLRTQVRGRLGEWISLGGSERREGGEQRGLTGYRSGSDSSASGSAIRVELLP